MRKFSAFAARRLVAILDLALIALGQATPLQDTLVTKMNAFAQTYRKFAEEHNRGIFDVRLAKELSLEWHAVETSGEWPKEVR